jgi:hypothetical protein
MAWGRTWPLSAVQILRSTALTKILGLESGRQTWILQYVNYSERINPKVDLDQKLAISSSGCMPKGLLLLRSDDFTPLVFGESYSKYSH